MTPSDRDRNQRGQGDKLRRDLIAATDRLLKSGATHETLSLRAVAREVGIAATSIYLHFPDKMALLLAVYQEHFAQLARDLREAVEGETDPARQLRAACLRYLRFAAEQPEAYHVMFTAPGSDRELPRPITDEQRPGAEAVAVIANVLNECVDAGLATPLDPYPATLCLWAALHGVTTLRQARPQVPWPTQEVLIDTLLAGYFGVARPVRHD
jgi:AcrR family transcriptional regulator